MSYDNDTKSTNIREIVVDRDFTPTEDVAPGTIYRLHNHASTPVAVFGRFILLEHEADEYVFDGTQWLEL